MAKSPKRSRRRRSGENIGALRQTQTSRRESIISPWNCCLQAQPARHRTVSGGLGRRRQWGRVGGRNQPQHRDACLAQHVLDYRIPQARSVILEMQVVRLFVEAEALEAIGVRKSAESTILLFGQRLL